MRIACILDDLFEDSEFQKPYEAFREAGHEVVIVGVEAGKEVKGERGRVTARVEKSFAETRPEEYEALFIPGGYSPDRLRGHPQAVAFVRHFFEADKPVFAICHGPQILITAGVVRGRRMTAWKTIQFDLRLAGAEVVDEPVVVDRNLVTSRQPDDLPAFIRESLALLQSVPARR